MNRIKQNTMFSNICVHFIMELTYIFNIIINS